jgi:hypothetical protein
VAALSQAGDISVHDADKAIWVYGDVSRIYICVYTGFFTDNDLHLHAVKGVVRRFERSLRHVSCAGAQIPAL